MSIYHHIDCEVDANGEWDAIVESGISTIVQSADAAFPERGNIGLRSTVSAWNEKAYAQIEPMTAIEAGGTRYFRWYFRYVEWDNARGRQFCVYNLDGTNENYRPFVVWLENGTLQVYVYNDSGGSVVHNIVSPALGRWYCVELQLTRASSAVASDGIVRAWVDGMPVAETTGIDNYDRANGVGTVRMGAEYYCYAGLVIDTDELVIADDYIGPYVPTPLTDYPEARRTVVLYRQASSDSREFADYCVDQLGVPRCNLCSLPNATANESLASYATFQTEVETDLAAWLTTNPTIAANCSTFLIGYGVPGYFTHGGVNHSATSRLMNYGTAFSSETSNPLYNPATVARLTKTALGGKYLCTRIDADTLQHAKDVLDCGLQIADGGLNGDDKLYSDESTYLASLNCQHLRIQTDDLPGVWFDDDAFTWGDTSLAGFEATGGERVLLCDDTADSGDTLRAASELFTAIITNGYASGLGNSETADTFDIDSFFEMLRIGGTLAEALAVAIANLDYTAVAVGHPLMTVTFQLGGYNIYQGQARADQIDYDTPVAYLRAGVAQANLVDLGLAEDTDWYFGCRAVSSKGVEEENTTVTTRVRIESGAMIGPPPNAIASASVVAIAAGSLSLSFRYNARGEAATATAVQVALVTGGVADWSSPLDTISIAGTCRKSAELGPFDHGSTVRLALRAVTAGGVGGAEYRLDPVVADSVGPGAVDYLIAAQEDA